MEKHQPKLPFLSKGATSLPFRLTRLLLHGEAPVEVGAEEGVPELPIQALPEEGAREKVEPEGWRAKLCARGMHTLPSSDFFGGIPNPWWAVMVVFCEVIVLICCVFFHCCCVVYGRKESLAASGWEGHRNGTKKITETP